MSVICARMWSVDVPNILCYIWYHNNIHTHAMPCHTQMQRYLFFIYSVHFAYDYYERRIIHRFAFGLCLWISAMDECEWMYVYATVCLQRVNSDREQSVCGLNKFSSLMQILYVLCTTRFSTTVHIVQIKYLVFVRHTLYSQMCDGWEMWEQATVRRKGERKQESENSINSREKCVVFIWIRIHLVLLSWNNWSFPIINISCELIHVYFYDGLGKDWQRKQ